MFITKHHSPKLEGKVESTTGLTLVELLVAVSLSVLLSTVVLSFYIFFAKATLVASNYSEFDREAGIFLQYFARDVKEAEEVVWISEKKFKLLKKGIYVTYSYNPKLQTVTRSSPGQVANTMASHLSALQFASYGQRK